MKTASEEAALLESVVFLDHFADLPDSRQLSKVIYPLDEILLLVLLATLAEAETFTAIAQFGKDKLDFCGACAHSPMERPIMTAWGKCLRQWIANSFRAVLSAGLPR